MISYLYEKEDKSGNKISVIHSDNLGLTPCYSLFLNSYADLVDKEFVSPTTAWKDHTTEIIWAEHNNKVVGFLTFINEWIGEHKLNFLFTFYTIPEYRNHGIFKILIEEFENISRKRNCAYYKVRVGQNDHDTVAIMKKIGLTTYFYSLQKVIV